MSGLLKRLLRARPALPPPETHYLSVGEQKVPVTVRRLRAAVRMTMRLDRTGNAVVLTLPPRVPLKEGLAFAVRESAAIASWLAKAQAARTSPAPDAPIPYRGMPHTVVHDPAIGRRVLAQDGELRVGGPAEQVSNRIRRWLREQALADLSERSWALATAHHLPLAKVSIGDARARWGSCSSDKSIRYSWRLILAPDWVRDEVVIHELAHLTHMNHSPAFWAEVARLGGHPSRSRRWLKQNAHNLHGVD
jgi:predicted metal-dependent hydrolase